MMITQVHLYPLPHPVVVLSGTKWWVIRTMTPGRSESVIQELTAEPRLAPTLGDAIGAPRALEVIPVGGGRYQATTIQVTSGRTFQIHPKVILALPSIVTLEQVRNYYRRIVAAGLVLDMNEPLPVPSVATNVLGEL